VGYARAQEGEEEGEGFLHGGVLWGGKL
jgi:hypothetical protein